MFLTFAKKLGLPAPVKKPEEKDPKLNNTLLGRSSNFNSTLGRSFQKKEEIINESDAEQSEDETEKIKVDLAVIDNAFDKFYKTQESLGGFLNIKLIKAKFVDFRKKLDVWKKTEKRRKKDKEKSQKYT